MVTGDLDVARAARAVKRGALVGRLVEWGHEGDIRWIDGPVAASATGARKWLEPQISSATEISLWAEIAGAGMLLLLWERC